MSPEQGHTGSERDRETLTRHGRAGPNISDVLVFHLIVGAQEKETYLTEVPL